MTSGPTEGPSEPDPDGGVLSYPVAMTSERGAVDVRAASRVLPRLGSVASRDASAIVALTLAILATYVVANWSQAVS